MTLLSFCFFQINIDYRMRESIVDQLKTKVDVSVFTEAQHQIYNLMHRDSYPRFLVCPLTEEITKEVLGKQYTIISSSFWNTSTFHLGKKFRMLIEWCWCRISKEFITVLATHILHAIIKFTLICRRILYTLSDSACF